MLKIIECTSIPPTDSIAKACPLGMCNDPLILKGWKEYFEISTVQFWDITHTRNLILPVSRGFIQGVWEVDTGPAVLIIEMGTSSCNVSLTSIVVLWTPTSSEFVWKSEDAGRSYKFLSQGKTGGALERCNITTLPWNYCAIRQGNFVDALIGHCI